MGSLADERRAAEMRRGAEVAAHHQEKINHSQEARVEMMQRLRESGVIAVARRGGVAVAGFADDIRDEKNENVLAEKASVIAAEPDDMYPSEEFVARCVLSVQALGLWHKVPEYSREREAQVEARRRRDQYRKNFVVNWRDR